MLDQANFSVIETLRNGSRVEIRAQRPQDRKDLEAALVRMSDESLYRRFFGAKRHFSEKEVEHFSTSTSSTMSPWLWWFTRIAIR